MRYISVDNMSEEYRLFIGNLPSETTKDTLRSAIAEEIQIDVHIPSRWRRRSARYAFVSFSNEDEMKKAIEQLEESHKGDDKLVISRAEPQPTQKRTPKPKQTPKERRQRQRQKQKQKKEQEQGKKQEQEQGKGQEQEKAAAEKPTAEEPAEPSKGADAAKEGKPAQKPRPAKRRLRLSESKLVPADGYVYVDLAPKTKAAQVDELFSNAGFANHKARVVVRPRRVTRRAGEKVVIPPKVFAFVWVGKESTQKAIDELSGKELNGSKIEVRPATSRVPLEPTSESANDSASPEKPQDETK